MSAGNERRDRYELSRRNTLLVGTADAGAVGVGADASPTTPTAAQVAPFDVAAAQSSRPRC
jgi:hypothetical protein